MSTIDHTLSKGAVSPAVTAQRTASMGSRMLYSRLIGALFLAGFVVYGVGFGLVTSVVGAPNVLSTIAAHQTTLVLGAFLMLLNTAVDVGKGVLFFPILENHGKRSALAYLALIIVQVMGAARVIVLDRVARVRELTDGWGADVVAEVSGAAAAWSEGIEMVGRGGVYLTMGAIVAG